MRPVTKFGRVASALSVGLALAALGGCILFTNSTDGYTQLVVDAGSPYTCTSSNQCSGKLCCPGLLPNQELAFGSECLDQCGIFPVICTPDDAGSDCPNDAGCSSQVCPLFGQHICGGCPGVLPDE